MSTLKEKFDLAEDEYIKFERYENPMHTRPDIAAFLLLDKLLPGDRDIVSGASHDEFYLDIDCDALNEVATDEDILCLVRCGVIYNDEDKYLYMFA